MARIGTQHLLREGSASQEAKSDILVRAVSQYAHLAEAEARDLDRLSRGAVRRYSPRSDIVREGDRPRAAFLVRSGWACRYKALPDGRRQIIAVLLPGDVCDLNLDLVRALDHSVAALSHVELTEMMPARLREAMCRHPRLIEAFYWRDMVNASVEREWVLNIGQRSALERLTHLICELYTRLEYLGLVHAGTMPFPMTQSDLADALGLTPVHVNRMMKELRLAGLIQLHSRVLTIPDLDALKSAGMFSDTYLHLGQRNRSVFRWD